MLSPPQTCYADGELTVNTHSISCHRSYTFESYRTAQSDARRTLLLFGCAAVIWYERGSSSLYKPQSCATRRTRGDAVADSICFGSSHLTLRCNVAAPQFFQRKGRVPVLATIGLLQNSPSPRLLPPNRTHSFNWILKFQSCRSFYKPSTVANFCSALLLLSI